MKKKNKPFSIDIHYDIWDEDTGYSAQCREFPGIITQGDNLEHLTEMIKDATELYFSGHSRVKLNFSNLSNITKNYIRKEDRMNIYEAYLAVKEGKIIKAVIVGEIYFVLEVTETYTHEKRIIRIEQSDAGSLDNIPTSFEGIDFTEVENVCLDCFDGTSSFSQISFEEAVQFLAAEWERENS